MNTKTLIGILALIVVIGGGYYYYSTTQQDTAPAMQQKRVPPQISWSFKDNGYSEEKNANTTSVTVTVNGTAHDAGTYLGSCSEMTDLSKTGGALSAALCWFAGAGDEIGVYVGDAEKLYIARREIQEPTAESPEFRGELTTLLSL